jgi:hypothetical protein
MTADLPCRQMRRASASRNDRGGLTERLSAFYGCSALLFVSVGLGDVARGARASSRPKFNFLIKEFNIDLTKDLII